MIGFGLDLSGYSTGQTALAVVEISGDVGTAVVLTGSAFSKYRHGADDGQAALQEERSALLTCLSRGPLAVDVPIDLQGLPAPAEYTFIWELTKRPVDYAFRALAPLADRLGACVARFKAVISADNLKSEIGTRLFETYPAASLELLGVPNKRYKGVAGREVCRTIRERLRFDHCEISDHDLDAIICAVTAAAPQDCRLEGARLISRMHEVDPFTAMTPLGHQQPVGYVLLDRWPCRRLTVSSVDFQSWLESRTF